MELPRRRNRDQMARRGDKKDDSGQSRRQVTLWQLALAFVLLGFLAWETSGFRGTKSATGAKSLGDEALGVDLEKSTDKGWGTDVPDMRWGDGRDVDPLTRGIGEGVARYQEDFGDGVPKDASMEKSRRLEAYVEWHQHRGAAPSLDEIMNLPSTNDRWAKESSAGDQEGEMTKSIMVTAVLNVFERKVLQEQLDSLFAQTAVVLVEEVWVCVFGRASDVVEYAQKVVDETHHPNVRIIVSDFDFKFYGRFQMALAVPSEFVWLLNDEALPGRKYLAQLIHASGTELLGRSLLGSVGAVLPRPPSRTSIGPLQNEDNQGDMLKPVFYGDQTNALPVDSLCSQWFLRTQWLQYMWRERPVTFETGENFHISHTLRKHASIGTYVMPYNANDDETRGSTYDGLSYDTSATEAGDASLRGELWVSALKAGTHMHWMDLSVSTENSHVGPSALIIFQTEDELKSMRQLVKAFLEAASPAETGTDKRQLERPWKLFLFSPTIRCSKIADLLHSSVSHLCSLTSVRVFAPTGNNLDWWSDALELERADPSAYERVVATNLRPVLHMIKARMVVMIGDPTVAGSTGAATGATDTEGMSPVALERAVAQAVDTYNEGLSLDGKDELATMITVALSDSKYLGFLPALDATTVAAWNEPKISMHVITNDRLSSLKRLIDSLKVSHFVGDEVQLALHVDTGGDEEMMDYLMKTQWAHGPKTVHHRIKNGGLVSAVSESFYPGDPHHYAIILEDDIEVSPAFYAWTKYILLRYRYSSGTSHHSFLACKTTPPTPLVGISLYTPRIEEATDARGRVDFKKAAGDYKAILSQTPSSWGSLYFPEVWTRLHTDLIKEEYKPIPGARVNKWAGSWKRYMFSLMYHNDWYMLYPAYDKERSFSTNYMEAGMHVRSNPAQLKIRAENFTVPLFEEGDTTFWGPGTLPLPDLEYLAKISVWSNVTRGSRIPPGSTGRR